MESDLRNSVSDRYPGTTADVFPADVSNSLPSPSRRRAGRTEWPTVDGPLGLSHEESVIYARRFFIMGFFCLPFLWAVNCFYFWPVLRYPHFHQWHPRLRG